MLVSINLVAFEDAFKCAGSFGELVASTMPNPGEENKMLWFLIFHVYVAPADAVSWDGFWRLDDKPMLTADRYFSSQAECEATAEEFIDKMNEGMLAPIRYNCLGIPSSLPKEAAR